MTLAGRAEDWLGALVTGAVFVALALVIHWLLFRLLTRIAKRSESATDDLVFANLRNPTRWGMIALGLVLAARETPLLAAVWVKVAGFVMPALIGWIVLAALQSFFAAAALPAGEVTAADDLKLRRRQTRLAIFARIATFIVVFVTVGLMLFSIPGVREVGVTLMASAGIAGLAVGAAAQPALKSLIAGLQMALTEPVSIGDVVSIEGQTGRVEDIRSTYVIVRTWDERRLLVPTAKFLETTFENWSREGGQLTGAVMLLLDPLADIPPLRAEFERWIAAHPKWDRRQSALQVTGMTAGAIEVRLVVSAASTAELFDLRCAVREAMLAWLRDNQPEAIARQRTEDFAATGG